MERRRREPHYYESADDRDMREVGRRVKVAANVAEAFGAT